MKGKYRILKGEITLAGTRAITFVRRQRFSWLGYHDFSTILKRNHCRNTN